MYLIAKSCCQKTEINKRLKTSKTNSQAVLLDKPVCPFTIEPSLVYLSITSVLFIHSSMNMNDITQWIVFTVEELIYVQKLL